MDEKTTKYMALMNQLHEDYLEHSASGGELEYILITYSEETVERVRELCRLTGQDFDEFKGVWIAEEEYIDVIGLWDHDVEGLRWEADQGFFIKASEGPHAV